MEFLGVGPKQLTKGIIDLDPVDAEDGADHQDREDDAGQDRCLHRDQAELFQPESNALRRRLLHHLDVDFVVAVFSSMRLSSPHIGSILNSLGLEGTKQPRRPLGGSTLTLENMKKIAGAGLAGPTPRLASRGPSQTRAAPIVVPSLGFVTPNSIL